MTRRNDLLKMVCCSMVLTLGSGCGGEQMDEESQPIDLLASVKTQTGALVEFYEVAPGLITVSEQAKIGQAETVTQQRLDTLGVEGLYRALQPAGTVPQALRAALKRKREIEQNPEPYLELRQQVKAARAEPSQSAGDDVSARRQAIGYSSSGPTPIPVANNAVWFHSNFCPQTGWDHSYCGLSRLNSSTWTGNDIWYANVAAAAVDGSIQLRSEYRVWYTWTHFGTWEVPQGYYRTQRFTRDSFDFDLESTASRSLVHCLRFNGSYVYLDQQCVAHTPNSVLHHSLAYEHSLYHN